MAVGESHAQGSGRFPQSVLKASLHGRLVEELRAMILDGQYPPGGRIPEMELCRTFNISRTPLREALKVLASEGLIELLPNRGARVVSLTLDDLHDLFGVMGLLNGYAGELSVQHITDEELQHMRRLQAEMRKAFDDQDLRSYSKINSSFHDIILRAARSAALLATHRMIAGRISVSRYQANFSRKRWTEALEEHDAILQLLQLRRGAELNLLLKSHILGKYDAIREAANNTEGSQIGNRGQ